MEDTAVAIFDCIADDNSELTFSKGDVLENIQQAADQGWFTGTLQKNGKTGLFPGNYVSFTKKQPKKLNAAEARANLMQKSSSLALKTRTAGEKSQVATEPQIQKPILQKPQHQPVAAPVSNVDPKPLSQLAKSFSKTALKSNESLLESEAQSTIPKVGKRPPLLVSNQAYVKMTDDAAAAESSQAPGSTQKAPPPRPVKPAALRGNCGSSSAMPNPANQGNRESTMSTLDDGTPFRPSNIKSLDSKNLDFSRLTKYKQDFKQYDTDNDGFLQGDQVKSIWMKSALDARSLGLIWNLCDPGNLGKLDMRGYVAGMFLIDEKLRGVPVPSTIPSELLDLCG